MHELEEGIVLGLGNPLLDHMTNADDDLLNKYNLKADNAILAEEQHMPIYDELRQKYSVEYVVGGATVNTVRMVQWLVDKPHTCTFIGCIGEDEAGSRVQTECNQIGLNTRLQVNNTNIGTGKCAVLLQNKCRSMVTYVGAANELDVNYIVDPDRWKYVDKAKFYYIAGYVITTAYDSMMEVCKHADAQKKVFAFNLSAPFLPTYFTEKLDNVLSHCNIIFGNREEIEAWACQHEMEDAPIREVLLQMVKFKPISEHSSKRIVIATQGADPVLVATNESTEVREFPVPQLEKSDIVDTNGAGDAFAAGFLAEHIKNSSLEKAIESGLKAANYIIRQSGFTLGLRNEYN